MKTQFFLILLIFLFLNTYSQNMFELLIDNDNAQRNTSVVIDSNGDYIVSSQEFIHQTKTKSELFFNKWNNEFIVNSQEFSELKNVEYNSILTKISSTGELIDTVYFNTPEREVILDIIDIGNNEFITIGAIYADAYEEMEFWLMKIDNELNIIWDKKIKIEAQILRANSKLNYDSDILIYGYLKKGNYNYNTFIFKIDENGNLLDSVHPTFSYTDICIFDILEKKEQTGYYAFQVTGVSEILNIDNEFNIISINSMPYVYASGNNSFWISDSTYILSGKISLNDSYIAIVIADTLHNSIDSSYVENEEFDMLAFWDNLSFLDNDNIYLVGTNNVSFDPYEKKPSWISINNFDDTLGLNWQKLIGGDAYYNATNVVATDDGGCFIACTRSDNTNYYDYDMYFLKLDRYGNYTNIEDNPTAQKTHEIILYPNPGTTQLNIRKAIQLKNCNFMLYDNSGKLVVQQKLTQDVTTLNTAHLQSGIYLYKVVNENKIVETGKWVKE